MYDWNKANMATWSYETTAATDPTSVPDAVSPRLINKTSLDQGKVPDDWKSATEA